jgi:tRNA(Ile)-lysidine synthetase-like protein
MNYNASRPVVLAVSGGVDSIVMLDIVVQRKMFSGRDIIVAHFDHGIRKESVDDRIFVQELAHRYGLRFAFGEAKLGIGVSEEKARKARYDFLRSLDGEIWTAHHYGDVLETVAINLIRGTGWRGLAVFGDRNVKRFFIDGHGKNGGGFWGKKEVLGYARTHGLEWREDSTNTDERYLRNKIRKVLEASENYDEILLGVGELFLRQREIANEIDEIISEILKSHDEGFSRGWLLELPEEVLAEVLRAKLIEAGKPQTRIGIGRLIYAIRNYENSKKVNLERGHLVRIGKTIQI